MNPLGSEKQVNSNHEVIDQLYNENRDAVNKEIDKVSEIFDTENLE